MKYRIITVTSAFGSGGRETGQQAFKRLGVKRSDWEIALKAAKETAFSAQYIEQNGEYASAKRIFPCTFMGRNQRSHIFQDAPERMQRAISQNASNESPCVIIGRGADVPQRDKGDELAVLFHAEDKSRQKTSMQRHYESDQETVKLLYGMDKKRSVYHKRFADREWGKSQFGGICLSSGQSGLDNCVFLICEAYRGGDR